MELGDVLARLSEADGPAGREDEVADLVVDLVSPWVARVERDPFGNVLAVRPPDVTPAAGSGAAGSGPVRLLLAAHMDEIALCVAGLVEGGFLRCRALGGVDARALVGEVVRVHGRQAVEGVVAFLPPHLTGGRERQEAPAVEELVVDTGLPDERLRRLIQPGDPITVRRRCQRLAGRLVTGKAMDNRAGVAALWVALRQLAGRRCAAEVAVAFTVQEELGYRGAAVLGERLRPDVALVVDVGFGGQPGVAEADALALGRGPGVTVGPNVHPLVRARLLATAAAERLPHQVEVTAGGSGTDAEALQVSGTGVATAVLSIPCRSMHSPAEVVSLDDVEATGRLLAAFAVAAGEDDGWVGKLRDGSWALGG